MINLILKFFCQVLVSHFSKSLDSVALTEFRNISQMFREGTCNANSYYGHCESVLGDRFENIFPELLVLLPDIDKQQVNFLLRTKTNMNMLHFHFTILGIVTSLYGKT